MYNWDQFWGWVSCCHLHHDRDIIWWKNEHQIEVERTPLRRHCVVCIQLLQLGWMKARLGVGSTETHNRHQGQWVWGGRLSSIKFGLSNKETKFGVNGPPVYPTCDAARSCFARREVTNSKYISTTLVMVVVVIMAMTHDQSVYALYMKYTVLCTYISGAVPTSRHALSVKFESSHVPMESPSLRFPPTSTAITKTVRVCYLSMAMFPCLTRVLGYWKATFDRRQKILPFLESMAGA